MFKRKTLLEEVLSEFPLHEQEIFRKIHEAYRARIKTGRPIDPNSIHQRAKAEGKSPQALWKQEKRKEKD